MKKLLLITFLFLITPDAKADMDYVCMTTWMESDDFILENCVRNNILYMSQIPKIIAVNVSASWCRQDREIHFQKGAMPNYHVLSCVLYDNKKRKVISKNK